MAYGQDLQVMYVDVSQLKSENIEPQDLENWKDEIERRMNWIDRVGVLLTPLVIYQDGVDDEYNPLFEVQLSDHNLLNFIAIYNLNQQQPKRFEMVNAWVTQPENAEEIMDCIDEFSFTLYDK